MLQNVEESDMYDVERRNSPGGPATSLPVRHIQRPRRGSFVVIAATVILLVANVAVPTKARQIAPEDKKLLDQALDAFQQASHLETELKKSERAVSAQTKELRTELAKAKATAASTGQSRYFRREERLDEELMKQAESETRRDKRLVSQAETEMKGDKKFLQTAYGISDIDAYEAKRKAKAAGGADSDSCAEIQHCHQAKENGLAPDKCVIGAGLCPTIQCYKYNPTTWCGSKQVCSKALSAKAGCFPKGPGRKSHWLKKTCPTMSCSQALSLGYTPDFCTITMMDGACPSLKCYHYTDMGSCRLADSASGGSVCMKPTEADEECTAFQQAAGQALSKSASQTYSGKRRGSGSGWSLYRVAGGTTGILCFIVFLSLLSAAFFWMFKKYGASLAIKGGGKPAPVPAYYGRL